MLSITIDLWYKFLFLKQVCGQQTFGDGPFNFQGGGGYVFFYKKIFWFPMLLKKYSDFGGGKKKSDSVFVSYKLLLNPGKK